MSEMDAYGDLTSRVARLDISDQAAASKTARSSQPAVPPSQLEQDTSELIESLIKLSSSNPKLVRSTPHDVEVNGRTKTVQSWKMNEYKYSTVPSPFPTLARGLFTEWVSHATNSKTGLHRVVARGYDKFFNMNEVPWNNWKSIGEHTVPPYYLTVKSNGCIIFMSALTPTEVVVMSKHSLGAVNGSDVSHAQMGEIWMDRHLKKAGKSRKDFAQWLWSENITAVAELCDDSFEEHVLPYSADETGLHLHGINRNQGAFETFSPEEVNKWAAEWGFIQTAYITMTSTDDVKKFTDEIGETGKWKGHAIEGFVVRTKVAHTSPKQGKDKISSSRDAPPYPPGSDFFFKIKFDEPYMTYRDWREITRTILAARKKGIASPSVPKSKLRRPESFAYRTWVTKEIESDPNAFDKFSEGKGIIAARQRFLVWLETKEGQNHLRVQGSDHPTSSNTFDPGAETWDRCVIVPIAVPGCGKTAVGVALTELFHFGHTQSDNITTKKSAPAFARNIQTEFKTHNIVFADRNNHLRQHREGIRTAIKSLKGRPIRVLALNWSLDTLPKVSIHRICCDRVLGRGENHQSLIPKDGIHEEVIWKFIADSEELGMEEADKVIEMNLEDSPEQAVRRVIDVLVPLLGLDRPNDEAIQGAVQSAMGYSPAVKKDVKGVKIPPPRYYGILPEIDIVDLINEAVESNDDSVPEEFNAFWKELRSSRRIPPRPHITISHHNNLPQEQAIWDACQAVAKPPSSEFRVRLDKAITDGRVMSLTVEELEVIEGPEAEKGRDFMAELPQELLARLHITVGTADKTISPYEGKVLTEKWKSGEVEGIQSVSLQGVKVTGYLRGLS